MVVLAWYETQPDVKLSSVESALRVYVKDALSRFCCIVTFLLSGFYNALRYRYIVTLIKRI